MKAVKWLGIPMALLFATVGHAQQNDSDVDVQVEKHVVHEGAASDRDRLREAQRALEAAAREVARLSVGAGGVIEQFKKTGRRAMLGITIEDTDEGSVVTGVSPGGPGRAERYSFRCADYRYQWQGPGRGGFPDPGAYSGYVRR